MAKKAAKGSASKTAKGSAKAPRSGLIDEVRQLVQLMGEHDLSKIDIREGDHQVLLERGGPRDAIAPSVAPAPTAPAGTPDDGQAEATAGELLDIKSPMVGTFYTAASSDSDPFVSGGDRVQEGMVVCIIEAMKVMNEIQAECSGTVVETCCQNAQPVEFGQVLYRVRP